MNHLPIPHGLGTTEVIDHSECEVHDLVNYPEYESPDDAPVRFCKRCFWEWPGPQDLVLIMDQIAPHRGCEMENRYYTERFHR